MNDVVIDEPAKEVEWFDWVAAAIDAIRAHRLQLILVYADGHPFVRLPPATQKLAEMASPWLRLATYEEANNFQLAIALDRADREDGRDLEQMARDEFERLGGR